MENMMTRQMKMFLPADFLVSKKLATAPPKEKKFGINIAEWTAFDEDGIFRLFK